MKTAADEGDVFADYDFIYGENATGFIVNFTEMEEICPDMTDEDRALLKRVSLWVEGVLLCLMAVPGFLGNISSCVILSSKDMRNSFNLLLVALACFDNVYLFGGILEAVHRSFGVESKAHVILFPYVLYPVHAIGMTGSVLLTVAIALERYIAVHYPLNYSQTVNDNTALRRRMLKYLLPVATLSTAFNVTKFLEATYDYDEEGNPILLPTELRRDIHYSIYFNWFRFVSLGVVPFALLVLFNAKIYVALRKRKQRRLIRRAQQATATAQPSAILVDAAATTATVRHDLRADHGNAENVAMAQVHGGHNGTNVNNDNARLDGHEVPALKVVPPEEEQDAEEPHGKESAICERAESAATPFMLRPPGSEELHTFAEADGEDKDSKSGGRAEKLRGFYNSSLRRYRERLTESSRKFKLRRNTDNSEPSKKEQICMSINIQGSGINGTTTFKSNSQQPPKEVVKANAKRRHMEDHLATIFMGYILVFLVCHSPRLMLNIYELFTIRQAMECQTVGLDAFPLWPQVFTAFSHLFLVLNSSINILIYSLLSSRFRDEVIKGVRRIRGCRNSAL